MLTYVEDVQNLVSEKLFDPSKLVIKIQTVRGKHNKILENLKKPNFVVWCASNGKISGLLRRHQIY